MGLFLLSGENLHSCSVRRICGRRMRATSLNFWFTVFQKSVLGKEQWMARECCCVLVSSLISSCRQTGGWPKSDGRAAAAIVSPCQVDISVRQRKDQRRGNKQ